MRFDRNGLQVLEREECLRLLRGAILGRVAVSADALPVILPVNFSSNGDRIFFRTGRGTKLDAATQQTVVAFEADDIDALSHTGWSVLVTGIAREVTDPEELEAALALPLARWAPGEDGRVVAVEIEMISGRRIVAGAP